MSSLQALNGGGELENFEYYFHLLVNTKSMKDVLNLPDFNINDSLLNWEKIGGEADGSHPLFDAGCK